MTNYLFTYIFFSAGIFISLFLLIYLHLVDEIFSCIWYYHNMSCWVIYESFIYSFIKQGKQVVIVPIYIQQSHLFL